MHYTKAYKLNDIDRQKNAIKDIREYMGDKKFEEIEVMFKQSKNMSQENFRQFCSLAGVYGYPVTAWHQHLYGATVDDAVHEN